MTSDPKQILAWIEDRYGKPITNHANGVHVAVVRIYGGLSIGMGSSKAQALYDLYCDLTTKRESFARPLNARRWELERRERIDQESRKQYSGVKRT